MGKPLTFFYSVMFARAQENKMLRETVGKLEHGRSWLEERMEALEARLAALTPDLKVPTTMRCICYNFCTSTANRSRFGDGF
jgi:hypothetical protein